MSNALKPSTQRSDGAPLQEYGESTAGSRHHDGTGRVTGPAVAEPRTVVRPDSALTVVVAFGCATGSPSHRRRGPAGHVTPKKEDLPGYDRQGRGECRCSQRHLLRGMPENRSESWG